MKIEHKEETSANLEAAVDQRDRKSVAFFLTSTSIGFLVLEGAVCLFSQRTNPWHGYLWFAIVLLSCVVVSLLLSSRRHNSPATLNPIFCSLGVVCLVHAFMTLIYAATLVPAMGASELMPRALLPIVVDLILAIRLLALDGESVSMVSEARDGTNASLRKPSPDPWHSVAASLSFALLIVLAFVWSFSSSFRFYEGGQLAAHDFTVLKPSPELLQSIHVQALFSCVHETIIRLFPLTVAHGCMLIVSHIRRRFPRIVALSCVFFLATWGHVLVSTNISAHDIGWISLYTKWFVPLVAPFLYALLLSYRALTHLSN